MSNFLKNNWLSVITLLSVVLFIVYKENQNVIIDNQVKTTVNIDSIKSKVEQDYRLKIDSINRVHNKEIYRLQNKNRKLEDEIKDLDTIIGELPDF